MRELMKKYGRTGLFTYLGLSTCVTTSAFFFCVGRAWRWACVARARVRRVSRASARAERGEAREISDRLIGLIGLPVSLFVRLAEKANSRDVCERFVHCPLGEIDLTCDN